MALRASRASRAQRLLQRRRKDKDNAENDDGKDAGADAADEADVVLLALSGGYHGDTLGAMDATEPSVFNGDAQTPWYRGRGLFLEPPTAAMEAGGEWKVRWLDGGGAKGGGGGGGGERSIDDDIDDDDDADLAAAKGRVVDAVGKGGLSALFSSERLHAEDSEIVRRYRRHILAAVEAFEASGDSDSDYSSSPASSSLSSPSSSLKKARKQKIIGALLFEPCLQGAGGMRLIDPAFQVALASVARRDLRVPIVADEVFSGLWRLGAVSGCDLLGVRPDVACYAKLLTGGTVPLAATLASREVFESFRGGGKAGALLHGHSYSAHAIGYERDFFFFFFQHSRVWRFFFEFFCSLFFLFFFPTPRKKKKHPRCAAAVESLKMLSEPSSNPSMCFSSSEKREEKGSKSSSLSPFSSSSCSSPTPPPPPSTCAASPRCPPGSSCARLVPLWDQDLLVELAGHSRVRRAHAIGTVLAVELREGGGSAKEEEKEKEKTQQQGASNYTATASARVAASLRRKGVYARPLGDVVYLMITPVSAVGVGQGLQRKLLEALDDDDDDEESDSENSSSSSDDDDDD